ncbi:unnamed protein product [Trichobilharzia szidati]|nr:unnamed protein product [Trichobilharzia szidati]
MNRRNVVISSNCTRRSTRISRPACDVPKVSGCKTSSKKQDKWNLDIQTDCGSQQAPSHLQKQSRKCSRRSNRRTTARESSLLKGRSHIAEDVISENGDSSLTDNHLEVKSNFGSSDDFESDFLSDDKLPKKKKTANLLLFSEFKPKHRQKRTTKSLKKANVPEDPHCNLESDSDDEIDWVEVNDEATTEVEFMNKLLSCNTNTVSKELEEINSTPLTIAVPLASASKKHSKQDPKLLEALALRRKIKEHYALKHLVHVLCFLAHSRVVNQACDSCLCQALGLSLLAKTNSVYNQKTKQFIQLSLWSVEHLEACVVTFLSHQGVQLLNEGNSPGNYEYQLVHRLSEYTATAGDCLILLVAALRSLGLDVRVILGLSPLPLLPNEATTISPATATKEVKPIKQKKSNRKIISSDEDDIFDADVNSDSPADNLKPGISLFAEVFLPKLDRWVCIDPSSLPGVVDKINFKHGFLYVIGACSVKSADPNLVSYVGRNPVDLSPRYVQDWCVSARSHRISAEKWDSLLNMQSRFFDYDAVEHDALVVRSDTLSTAQRDRMDKDSINAKLLSQPLPKRIQDFKNHPLYVLQRHLLKFQVIYPTDAIPLGFFNNEPVYSRDCVHLCHTRESWLKEAMVVREHEKPAKIVKARLSMKRKLLQGSDSTPPTTEVFGPWQVEPYVPPVAENGIVPRNAHGNVELFKQCMLPVGCVHICLSGIQHVAKKLGIDCAEAIVGWSFHAGGWAHPKTEGYVVCKESVPVLIDAWRAEQMNAAKAANEERTERALENWKRLVRGIFIWHRVKAQFALAPLHSERATVEKFEKSKKNKAATIHTNDISTISYKKEALTQSSADFDISQKAYASEGWIRLGAADKAHLLPKIPVDVKKCVPKRRNPTRAKRKAHKYEESSSEESDTQIPSTKDDDSAHEFVDEDSFSQ